MRFIQDNQSFSSKGVLRGLHLQTRNDSQAKLVRVLSGEALDMRPGSLAYGQHVAVELSTYYKKTIICA